VAVMFIACCQAKGSNMLNGSRVHATRKHGVSKGGFLAGLMVSEMIITKTEKNLKLN